MSAYEDYILRNTRYRTDRGDMDGLDVESMFREELNEEYGKEISVGKYNYGAAELLLVIDPDEYVDTLYEWIRDNGWWER